MFDPDRTYTSDDIRRDLYFSAHGDMPGTVELHIPGCYRTLKMTAAAAEDLATNLEINAAVARLNTVLTTPLEVPS